MSAKKSPVSPPRPRTRRRDDALAAAIREAIQAELADYGYPGVSYEGVARRAQTSKPVLYRRYSSRARMVFDALPTLRWQPDEDQVWTDSLRADLMLVFGATTEVLLAFGVENYRNLIAEADDELFADLEEQVSDLAYRTIFPALERARARGELGPHEVPDRAALTIGMLVRNELVFSRKAFHSDTIAEILDAVYLPLIKTLSFGGTRVEPSGRHRSSSRRPPR